MPYPAAITTERDIELKLIDLGLPDHMRGGVINYLCHGIISPQGFLHSLFSNDFLALVLCADAQNRLLLREWAMFLRDIPGDAHGSPAKVEAYCKKVKSQSRRG